MTETNITIDPNTGLPTLPGGFFWNVAHRPYQPEERTVIGHTPIDIPERPEAYIVKLYQKLPGAWKTFESYYGAIEYKEGEIAEDDTTRAVFSHNEEIKLSWGRKREEPVYYKEDFITPDPELIESDTIKPEDFSEEAIRATAFEVYDAWQKKIATEALLGNYPPNKLTI